MLCLGAWNDRPIACGQPSVQLDTVISALQNDNHSVRRKPFKEKAYRGHGKMSLAMRECEVITVTRPGSSAATYLVGGGIASLAAAAFLIRDGDVPGHTITILEESPRIGGSLDTAGNDDDGYVMRGGRMIESKYL